MDGYTDEDLRAAGLSDEEIAAMKEEEQAPEQKPEDATPPEGNVPPETPPDDGGKSGAPAEVAVPETPPSPPVEGEQTPPPAEGDAIPAPAETPPAEPEKPPVGDKAPLPVDPFAAKFTGPTVTQEAYDAALADLKKQAQDGTIDMFEYADKVADLKADFKAAQAVSQFAEQANAATAGQKWQYAQDVFKSVHPEYQNPAMWGALDGMVRQLASDPEAAKLSDIGFLSLAHEKVQEALGLNKPASAEPAPIQPSVPKTPQPPERAPALERDKDKIPPSLGGLPAAQSSQPQDEFSEINNMTGLDQEAAVAAMLRSDPAKYDRWLRG